MNAHFNNTLGFLSTLSLRRATLQPAGGQGADAISIHALLAESDAKWIAENPDAYKFLSTLSLRRATRACPWIRATLRNFYPRSPCGERLLRKVPILGIK